MKKKVRSNIPLIGIAVSSLLLGSVGSWAGGGKVPKSAPVQLGPAPQYSGNSPIEMKNGILFNNGTFGAPNPEIESWAQAPTIVPGVSEKPYPFSDKKRFVAGVKESLSFVEHAIWNWEKTSPDTKPEAIEYSKAATQKLKPLLENARSALAKAKSANSSQWEQAQADARQALIELRSGYSSLHKNVPR